MSDLHDPGLAEALQAALHRLRPDAGPVFGDLLDAYERGHVPTLAPNSRKDYLARGRQLRTTAIASMRLAEITTADVLEATRVSTGNAGRATLGRHVARVFTWAGRTGMWAGGNPAATVPAAVSPVPDDDPDESEVRAILAVLTTHAVGPSWAKLCLAFLALSGWRSSEALTLPIERVRPSEYGGAWADLKNTKAGKQRRVISDAAYAIMRRAAGDRIGGHAFLPADMAVKRGREVLRETLRRACVKANIKVRRVHSLRHGVASILNARGVALADVAGVLGHRNLRSTLRYLHRNRAQQRAAVQALGDALVGVQR